MAKTKTKDSKKAEAATALNGVKNGGVSKASQTPKAKSKELAKVAAQKIVKEKDSKKSKKSKQESSSESESESESEADSDSDSSDSSDSDAGAKTTKAPATNGKANGKVKGKAADSSSESESDSDASDSDSEEEAKPKAKTNGAAPKTNGSAKAAAESSDSSDSSESDEGSDDESADEKPAAAKAVNGKAKPAAKDDDSDDSEEDSDGSDDSEADSDDSESDSEAAKPKAEAPSKKRKAEDTVDATPKKTKTETENAPTTLFAGSLSWGTDDDLLYKTFEEFGGLKGARVVYDKNTGRSRGFGYVDFDNAESCNKAYEAMQGQQLDGRALNLDYANARPAESTPQARAADRAQKHGDHVSPESDTLFVGNLPFDTDQDTVHAFFSEVCEVASIRLPTDPESGSLKGFGYVTFNSVEDAKSAFQAKNGSSIGHGRSSRAIRLDFAGARPPREGGGFGGRGGGRGGFGGRGGGRGGGDRGGRGRGGFGGRGGGRGGFNSSRGGGSSFSGTKVTFD